MGNYDKIIFLDTEFIGDGPITNQVVEIGWSLFDGRGATDSAGNIIAVKLDSGKIGPIRINIDRKWNPKCKERWHSIPQMKQFADRLDHDTATAAQLATEEEIEKIIASANANSKKPVDEKVKKILADADARSDLTISKHYALVEKDGIKVVVETPPPTQNENCSTSSSSVMLSERQAIAAFVDAVRKLQTYYKFEEKVSRWAFATDTVSNDCTHLNAMLNRHGHPSLTNFFNDSYNDVVCTKSAQTLALGCGLNKVKREWRKANDPHFPKNLNAHDAQSDAIFIGESYFYYLRAAAEEQVEKEIEFAKTVKSNRRMRKYVAISAGVTIAAVVTGAVAIFMGVRPSRIPVKSSPISSLTSFAASSSKPIIAEPPPPRQTRSSYPGNGAPHPDCDGGCTRPWKD